MKKKKGKQIKQVRNREGEDLKLLKTYRLWANAIRMKNAIGNNIGAMLRQGLIDQETHDEMLKESQAKPFAYAAEAMKGMEYMCKQMPLWKEWGVHVRGLGIATFAKLAALIGPCSDFDTRSDLYAYAGYDVRDGKARRRKVGEQANWNQALKSECYIAAKNFVKQGDYYRRHYDNIKLRRLAVNETRPEAEQLTKIHIENQVLREVSKRLLSHWWEAWRDLHGLSTERKPFPIAYLGHSGMVSCWDVIPQKDEASVRMETNSRVRANADVKTMKNLRAIG